MRKIPKDIADKYPRKFKFRYKKRIIAEGKVGKEDVVLPIYQKFKDREFWKGVELLHFEKGNSKGEKEFRFMYWTKKRPNIKPVWGQFNVCIPKSEFKKLTKEMKEKGWI